MGQFIIFCPRPSHGGLGNVIAWFLSLIMSKENKIDGRSKRWTARQIDDATFSQSTRFNGFFALDLSPHTLCAEAIANVFHGWRDHTINTGNALTSNASNYPFNYRVLAVFQLSLSRWCASSTMEMKWIERKRLKWRNDISPMHVISSASSIVPSASCFRNSICVFRSFSFSSLNDSVLLAITVTHLYRIVRMLSACGISGHPKRLLNCSRSSVFW